MFIPLRELIALVLKLQFEVLTPFSSWDITIIIQNQWKVHENSCMGSLLAMYGKSSVLQDAIKMVVASGPFGNKYAFLCKF